jgi:hypothetical protein
MSDSEDGASPRFGFSATLRVMCVAERHKEIERETGLVATHQHARGEEGLFGRPWPDDLWALESPRPRGADLNNHLQWIWEQVRPHQDYFRALSGEEDTQVDLFCGYRTDCAECGFEICPEALEITQALDIPLEVSVVLS